MKTKKDDVLTLLLIIVIVIIVGIIGYLGFEIIDGNIKQAQSEEITKEFDDLIPTITEEDLQEIPDNEEKEDPNIGEGQEENNQNETTTSNNNGGTGSSSGNKKGGTAGAVSSGSTYSASGVYINGLWTVGTIRIPTTGIKYSIFTEPITPAALEKGVGVVYTMNGLNQPGNTVIAGHNYRTKAFFSRNKNLAIGNIIYIKDTSGVEIAYEIYNKFTTYESDTSFYQRDTGGKREINLTTCTDNGTKTGERLIISAREK